MKRFSLRLIILTSLVFAAVVCYAQVPTVNNAKATSLTNVQITFDGGSNISAIGASTNFTIIGVTVTAATLVPSSKIVNLTVNALSGTNFSCTNCLDIAAGAVTNGSGPNTIINNKDVADNIAPTVTITRNAVTFGSFTGTTDNSVSFAITFSENIDNTTFTIADIALNKTGMVANTAPVAGDLTGASPNYTFTVNGITGDGDLGITVGPTIADLATAPNNMASSSSSAVFTIDNNAPTATVTRNAVTLGSFAGTTDNSVSFSIVFNQPINTATFGLADIAITAAGTANTAPVIGDLVDANPNFTFTINGITGDGNLSITVGPNLTDPSGNAMAGSSASGIITIDNTPPPAPTDPDLTAATDLGASNSDDVTKDNTPNFTITGTSGMLLQLLSDGVVVGTQPSASGSAQTLTASVLSDGIRIISARTTDAAGNTTTSAGTLAVTIDTSAPSNQNTIFTPSVTKQGGAAVTIVAGSAAEFNWFAPAGTVNFAANGTTITTALGDATSITAPNTEGNYKLFVLDLAGNASPASTATLTVDNTGPTSTATYTKSRLNNGTAQTVTVTFGEAVTGTPTITLTGSVSGAIATNQAMTGGPTIWTYNAGSTWTGDQTVTVTVGTATDAVGNLVNANPTTNTFVVDNTAPAKPGTPDLINGSDSGSSNSDNITNNLSPQFSVSTTETNATVRIFSTIDGGIRGSAVAAGAITTVNTTLVTQGDLLTHNITAVQTDLAGNVSLTSNALTITLDATSPTRTAIVIDPRANSKERIYVSLSEPLGLADNTTITGITIVDPENKTTINFIRYETVGYTDNSSTITIPAYPFIVIESNNSGDWDVNSGVTYTIGGNIKDAAGNEMGGFINSNPGDNTAPALGSGLIFNPNGTSAETITFNLTESLNIADGATVYGFSVSQGASTAVYSAANQTITLTSTGSNGLWNDNATVSYIQTGVAPASNVKDISNNEMANFVAEPILLKSVHLQSDNTTPTLAKATNTLTLSFISSRVLSGTPTITIGGQTPALSGTGTILDPYIATISAGSVGEGNVTFLITAPESSKSTDVSVTSDGSAVTCDKTAPTISPVTIASNNANTSFAKSGDIVTLTFTVNESLLTTPVVSIGGNSALVSNVGLVYTATVTVNNTYPEGALAFNISLQDLAGNATSRTTTTNASSVTFDATNPTVSSIVVNNSIINGYSASINGTTAILNGNQIDFLITFSEPVNGVTFTTLNGVGAPSLSPPGFPTVSVNPASVSPVTSGGGASTAPSQYWKVIGNNITGTGTFRLDLKNDFTVTDRASLVLSVPGVTFAGPTYTISMPQPTNPVGALQLTSIAPTSLTVNWTDVPTASHYLVILTTATSAPAVADGTYVANDNNFGDGVLTQNISQGTQSATFTGMTAGVAYNVFIYPYALSPNTTSVNTTAIDFNSTTPATLSRSSDIIKDLSFSYSQNIDYKTFQAANIPTGTGTGSVILEQFQLRDGAGSSDSDGFGTTLSSIVLDVVNYQNLRQLALYDGTTEIQELSVVAGPNVSILNTTTARVTFNSLAAFAANDNGNKTLSVRASFIANGVVDNQIISFSVVSATASGTTSSQFKTDTPVGIQSNLPSGTNNDNNKIEVTASKLDYTSIPLSATINTNFGPVIVEARDVNANRDLDFGSAVSAFSNNDGISMINTPFTPDPILSFSAGVLNFPATSPNNYFQFTSTPADGSTQLSISAGGINNQLSPAIGVVSSQESILYYNSAAFLTRLPYISFQSSDITGAGNSVALASFVLQDGNGVSNDLDGAPTKLSEVTFDITTTNNLGVTVNGAKDIRRIALYNASGTELGEQTLSNNTSVTFTIASAANYITANDDLSTTFTIRATFLNDNVNVRDLDNIKIKVSNVKQGSGSELNTLVPSVTNGSWTKATGAVTNGQLTPADKNIVDVVATKLQFTQQPPSVVGINRPVPLPPGNDVKIVANDANSLIDLEFNSANSSKLNLSVPSAQLQTTSFAFTDGEVLIDKNSLVFLAAGDGTLTATASNNPPTATSVTAAVSILVDVFDVTAIYSFGGVNTNSNIAGGSVNKIIYGVTFNAPFTRSSDPKLNSFVISFDNTITGVFKNPRVFEQKNNSVYSSIIAKNITDVSIKGKVTQGGFSFTVDFTGVGGVPRDFNAIGGTTYTYFLMVDVETTANSGTPPIQPYVEDLDWKFGVPGSFDPTAGNIITSSGSTHASKTSTSGLTYSFAAIYPPSLISSNPAQGQLNVDPNSDIELTFDAPIWSLDGTIELFQTNNVGTPGVKVGDLLLIGNAGRYDSSKPQNDPVNVNNLSSTITFDVTGPLAYNQIYYINIKKGTFDQTLNTGTGIIDKSGNKFPGIFSPGVRYFRTSSNIAPKLLSTGTTPAVPFQSQIINISLTGATIQATFDVPGTAYFMLTNRPTATPPTNDQIKGDVAYAAALTRGNFTINQINPITQFGTINYAMSNNQQYDVWMFAENNDLPTPVRTVGPYQGAPTFTASASPSSPTFTFTATTPSGTGIILYTPTYSICPGSYQPLNEPITIVERNAGDFSGTGSGIQTFNLLLPPGFQFDTSLPVNGQVILSGTVDFIANSGSLSFLSNSVVQVSYTNATTPNNSIDNISISGLKVLATGAAGGDITRLGGTALTAASALPDGTTVATIGTNIIEPISFTNSYLGEGTILPDLINDKFRTVQLIPTVAADDYGSSTFSGQGVNLDSLYLSSVPLGLPFNITITHTDNNGCVSQNAIQYLVYDHTTGLGLAPSYCITNNYFPTPGTYPTTYSVFFNSFPGFYLTSLSTDVPVTVTSGSQFLDNVWSSVVQSLPVKTGSGFNPNDNPKPGTFYFNYNFDVQTINDGTDWYYFRNFNSATGQDKPYYQGGSLGRVEYTGLYQSIANAALFDVKLVQSTQFFAPAIAYIELSGNISNGGVPLTNDPTNPVVASDFDPKNRPSQPSGYLPNLGNPGTFIFCEQGGDITINAYPAASGGTSVGKFTLVDHSTGNALTLTPDPASPGNFLGFKDNGNGVATIKPTVVNNSYNNIRIVYEYQDNNSPCKSIAAQVIRITPNPVANFTTSMLCEDINISFTDTSTIPAATGVSIATATWSYSDTKASTTENADTIFYPSTRIPIHMYSESGSYPNVSLNVITNFGCANVLPATKTLSIGGTPQVVFSFVGIATTDPITFVNASTVANDLVKQLDWTFGDGNVAAVTSNFGSPVINNYANAGPYTANLKVTSAIGCNSNLSKLVIILPRVVSTIASPYLATFETNNGGWQHAPTDTTTNMSDSWEHGGVNKPLTKSTIDGTKAWATSLTGKFSANERSALYSPSFDISGLARPMISFDKFVQFNRNEGVIIQYSIDNKNVADETKAWFVLGEDIDEGVEWFNGQSIASKPGDQPVNDFGWYDSDVKEWREAKHTISNVSPKPPVAGATRVVFRFALAARASDLPITVDNEGFAMDNFRVGDRTRIILHESFANTGNSSSQEKSENTFIRGFKTVGTDVVRINYHTGFPGTDPFNLHNPADNSSRALFYNVSSTPDSYLDGEYGGIPLLKQKFSAWGEKSFDQQTLSLANAKIKINHTIDGDGIKINVDVTAIETTIPKDSVALFIGILEESIPFGSLSGSQQAKVLSQETVFDYVLKKMLPSAAGTVLSDTIANGTTKNFGLLDEAFTWKPDPTKFSLPKTGDLAIVAFLQNVVTKKIYQSSIVMDLNDPVVNVVTGIEAILPEQVNVYPNPASKEFRVELPAFVQNEVPMNLIDLTGRKHYGGVIGSGSNKTTVNVENLSEGIYILEIGSGSTGIIRKKIMVVMKN